MKQMQMQDPKPAEVSRRVSFGFDGAEAGLQCMCPRLCVCPWVCAGERRKETFVQPLTLILKCLLCVIDSGVFSNCLI